MIGPVKGLVHHPICACASLGERGRTRVAPCDRLRGRTTSATSTPSCTRNRVRGIVVAFPLRRVGAKNRCTPVLGNGVSRARYVNPQIGRFWTMDTYEGTREQPQSLHKYLYCDGNPENGVDPSGLTLWLCTRKTADEAPVYGFGRHCYIWDDRTNVLAYLDNPPPGTVKQHRSVGQELSCGSGETWEVRDVGPIAGQTGTLPVDVVAYSIDGSVGHEEEIMEYGRQHINDSWWWFFGYNDCHTAAVRVLSHFPYLTIPRHDSLNYNDLPQRHLSNANSGIAYLFFRMMPSTSPISGDDVPGP